MDRSQIGHPALYLASACPVPLDGAVALHAGDWLGSGTFRNSLYTAPWRELTGVEDLWLRVEAQGRLRVRVMRAAPEPGTLLEFEVQSSDRQAHEVRLGWLADHPSGARLYWHVEAVEEAVLHDLSWCTSTPPTAPVRLAVLMRTHGRTRDLQQQLRRFDVAGAHEPHHQDMLRHCAFWVLDSSADAEALWQDSALRLHLQVLTAPNLGGGGNASHLMLRFHNEQQALPAEQRATELLLLDDDLSLSTESLARYVAMCAWRRGEHVMSLPVLMKSQPQRVWEDGGFWGCDGFSADPAVAPRRHLSPTLVRHGLSLDSYAPLDQFNALNRCEYVTFIFFGFPASLLPRLGLPAAMFLRGDDIEYSLRAQALGAPVYTNPNLAAWHEPGHGYSQEYMAILHGVIVNLRHGDGDPTPVLEFFEQRLHEHARTGDLAALALYLQVLDDLLATDNALLTPEFVTHYLHRLPNLGRRLNPVSTVALASLRERALRGELQLLPFLYPGFPALRPQASAPVVLVNEAAGSCASLPESTPQARLQATQALAQGIARLADSFELVGQHWQLRLAQSGTLAFWQDVATKAADRTRWLLRREFEPVSVAPCPAPVQRPLKPQRPPALPAATVAADTAPPWHHRWRELLSPWRRRTRLPADFHPATYLALHADVANAGVDPVAHYLRYGHREGRRYRTH